jgi:hypothetical protein
MPDSASGVRHVAGIPRDDVQMEMVDRLACGLAGVQSDVVPIRSVLRVESALERLHKVKERVLLVTGCVPPR